MGRIGGRNTHPELLVRSFLHRHGFRFRLHGRGLPGRPDIVLKSYRAVVCVHGCYWHRHPGCHFAYTPKSNMAFWAEKFRSNVERDAKTRSELEAEGWDVFVIWECQAEDGEALSSLASSLAAPRPAASTPVGGAKARRATKRRK